MARRAFMLLVLLLALGGGAAALYQWLGTQYVSPGPAAAPVRLEIAHGASVRAVLAQLGAGGVLQSPTAAAAYLRLHRVRPQLKAGTYEFPAHASPAQVLRMLELGAVVLEQLTVVEGSTFAEFRRALEQHPAVAPTLRGRSDAEVMTAIGHGGEFAEGRFFPDTYRFAAHTQDVDILKLAYGAMDQAVRQAWGTRAQDLAVSTPYEALILASIVEKETALPAERPRIAGVFTARLKKGMRLQSDPTVIYGMGARYDGDIRTRDLTTDTPYNTYTRGGLPPTPIALPGRESIRAAVSPEASDALYFVAVGDGTGAHYFSRTLEEHNAAVQRYLARLRAGRPTVSTDKGTR